MNNSKDKKDQSQNEGYSNIQTLVKPSEIKGFQIKKYIAKLKKSNNKSFKQKPIIVVPIFQNVFNHNQMFMIHGFIEVETQYRDYSDHQEINMISIQNQIVSIKSIEKSTNLDMIIMNMQCNGSSGLKDFQTLIDYFSQQPNADFYIAQAIDDYQAFFFEQVKQRLSQDEFILASFSALNIETQDIEPRNMIISRALLSLFGIEMSQEQELLHQSFNISNIFGKERLKAVFSLLEFSSNFEIKRTYEYSFTTIDYINFTPQVEYEYIDWPQRPPYLQKIDLVGVIIKINVPLNQLKSIIEIRKQEQTNKSQGFLSMQNLLDYQIQTEIFIEKFYPQLVKEQEKIKELSLRHLNKQLNRCS
ncbi:hypothetical protein TTHERM_00584560 (macronuclear) [Tetrahymena thermophila SB210]|uniref:Uncharacterized protein n=1 Tax=Tetrahymena thermophila (strain SB210) TaxID=312017 RepID=I7MG67_TETTS|nr:hypothetical protein TTHERM_00584560 [Tetrahymena thermophila SB210]EAR84900.2 hypothetical protein TTHERM_00584560 [Tetrahymena thermophila SB210]|eukprot:XP_001032563.2 hypothetical protein TTHERM_00584560 [Tetrahymena thermophila SB210]